MKIYMPLVGNYTITGEFGPRDPIFVPGFGWTADFHYGIDYGANAWTPIHAAHDGVVTKSSWDNTNYGGGNELELKSYDNIWSTWYLHMIQLSQFKVGDHVKRGQVIGYVGSTGLSNGNHLHFELHNRGKAVNPQPYLDMPEPVNPPKPKPPVDDWVGKEINIGAWWNYKTAADAKAMRNGVLIMPAGRYRVTLMHDGVPHLEQVGGSASGWVHPSVLGTVPEPVKPPVQRLTIPKPWYIYRSAADAEAMRNWSTNPIPAGTYLITHWSGNTPHLASLNGSPLGWINSSVMD